MTARRRTPGVLLVLVVSTCVAASAIGLAAPAEASPYPSWSEVQAAKGHAAAAQKQISTLDAAISTLQKRASDATDSASGAGERFQVASLAAADAKSALTTLTAKKAKAAATAKKSRQQVGQLVAELSHAGGGQLTVTMLTDSDKASDLLYQLGAMTNLTSKTAGFLEQAKSDENAVTALADQATAAQTELDRRTKAASDALAKANSLSETAGAALAAQEKNQSQLIEQVAYLKGTSVDVETAYFAGKAAGTAADASGPAVTGSTTSGSTTTGSTSTGSAGSSTPSQPGAPAPSKSSEPVSTPSKSTAPKPPVTTPNPPVTAPKPPVTTPTPPVTTPPASSGTPAAVTTAMAFARAQLGKTYVWGAAGPNQWDCSGLMMGSYSAAGVYIGGHSVRYQYNYLQGEGRLVAISSMKPGDIIFYHNATDGMYHDAMYIGGGQMLEAPNPNALVRIVAVRYFQLYAVGRPVG